MPLPDWLYKPKMAEKQRPSPNEWEPKRETRSVTVRLNRLERLTSVVALDLGLGMMLSESSGLAVNMLSNQSSLTSQSGPTLYYQQRHILKS